MRAATAILADLFVNPAINPRHGAGNVDGIKARIAAAGFVDPLTVRDAGGRFEVIDGSRRLRALAELAADGRWPAHWPVAIDIVDVDDAAARDIALGLNVERADLSPADEARGFYRLKLGGTTEEEIAARFAVPLKRVRQRMALGALPDAILDALRAGEITVATAEAFTLTVSAERQAALFAELRTDARRAVNAQTVREALTGGAVAADTAEALFVGLDAYAAAGGTVIADLFRGDHALADRDLLQRLYAEKLDATVRSLKDEGWSFVEVMPNRDRTWNWDRLDPAGKRQPTEEEAARIAAIEARRAEISAAMALIDDAGDEGAPDWQDRYDALDAEDDGLAAELLALRAKPFTAKQMKKSGVVIVTGEHRVEIVRGLVKPAPAAGRAGATANPAGEADAAPAATLPDSVHERLAAVAQNAMQLAMATVRPALAARMGLAHRILCALARGHEAPFRPIHFPALARRAAGDRLADALTAVGIDMDASFAAIVGRLEAAAPEAIVAVEAALAAAMLDCSSLSNVDVCAAIAMVDPDMTAAGWRPDADFFAGLGKAQICAALAEMGGTAKPAAKKPDLAAAAADLAAATAWLPAPLRTPSYAGPGSAPWAEARATAIADAIVGREAAA